MSDTVTDPVAALVEQWDTEAQSARDDAETLASIAPKQVQALRNLARITAHHADQLRAAMADAR